MALVSASPPMWRDPRGCNWLSMPGSTSGSMSPVWRSPKTNNLLIYWSEREDLNPRPPEPHSGMQSF